FRCFDRVLAFDAATGVCRCEAGITLGRLFELAAPLGWYLPVQPGHPDLTVGGCLAADSHGKHPSREGTFRQQVLALTLFHPATGMVEVAPSQRGEVFDLTCGGYGLTGTIVTVTLQLRRAPAACEVTRVPVRDLTSTVEVLEEREGEAALLYSWNDLSSRGGAFGRGFVCVGRAVDGAADANGAVRPYQRLPRAAAGPVPWWNRPSARLFNAVYSRAATAGGPQRQRLFDVLFPIGSKAAYFKLFGREGLHEYQALLPRERFAEFATQVRKALTAAAVAPTLGSCKLFAGNASHLRFDGRGVALAIDLPRRHDTPRLLERLDGITADCGGIPNIIKDSRLPAAVVARCYPGYEEFRTRLRAHDSDRLYRSELSQRLEL
ncbi:MAG TPA: FAD-binding protein, partial [Thermoanaerobaculia bacterium]|nr:FAD-binding protein [Thermoanaerobaculia bacterium]